MSIGWVYLLGAGILEIAATTAYRHSGFLTKLGPSALFIALGFASFMGLQRASVSGIPIGTAYAVWTGVGAAGTVLIGLAAYGEPASAVRIALLAVIVACVVGLKLASPSA